jgi:hypothetical protein
VSDAIDQELIDFLLAQGHSQERAIQIAGNHPDAVRADLEAAKAKGVPDAEKEAAPKEESGAAQTEKSNPSA